MTDKQCATKIRAAVASLKKTTQGYTPSGVHWKRSLRLLSEVAAELDPPKPKVPNLGPLIRGGPSVLTHDLTHETDGIPLYPAWDDAFSVGTEILAPEFMVVSKHPSSSNPGHAFYTAGTSEIDWWFGHLDRDHPLGKKFEKGAVIGKVAPNNVGGGPHCHVGVNVERLLGKGRQLIHKTSYQHGAPTIGEQLERLL